MRLSIPAQRTLDLDIENRPLSYAGDDFTFSEITAIACADVVVLASGKAKGQNAKCWLLGIDHPQTMLEEFRERYEAADIITGHNIRKHDLRLLNGAMLEYGYGPLPPRLFSDTYLHLKTLGGVSKSQESLAAMCGVKAQKIHMNQKDWRDANRLYEEGVEKARARCIGDVRQHIEMRAILLERGWLRAPRMWTP